MMQFVTDYSKLNRTHNTSPDKERRDVNFMHSNVGLHVKFKSRNNNYRSIFW